MQVDQLNFCRSVTFLGRVNYLSLLLKSLEAFVFLIFSLTWESLTLSGDFDEW